MKRKSIIIIVTLSLVLVFVLLWIFHGGADQSEVIIEEMTPVVSSDMIVIPIDSFEIT